MSHTKACLANALICAVENWRDVKSVDDVGFRIAAQDNFLSVADGYLREMPEICKCPEPEVNAEVEEARDYLRILTYAVDVCRDHSEDWRSERSRWDADERMRDCVRSIFSDDDEIHDSKHDALWLRSYLTECNECGLDHVTEYPLPSLFLSAEEREERGL